MTDAQVAEVTDYIRSQFGNAYTDPITPAEVAALRPPEDWE
jgi:mono/diheme cytochrome c family protein